MTEEKPVEPVALTFLYYIVLACVALSPIAFAAAVIYGGIFPWAL